MNFYVLQRFLNSPSIKSLFYIENTILYGDDVIDDDEEDEDEEAQVEKSSSSDPRLKKKKKKAIVDYRTAMSSVGSKAVTSKSGFIRPKTSSASGVLVSENDYSTSENWLIEDMGLSGTGTTTTVSRAKTSSKPSSEFTSGSSIRGSNSGASNKRKHAARTLSDEIATIDEISPMEVVEERNSSRRSNEKIEEIVLDDSVSRKKTAPSTTTSSSSKKRILESEVISLSDLDISSPGLNNQDYSSNSRKNFNYPEKEPIETTSIDNN